MLYNFAMQATQDAGQAEGAGGGALGGLLSFLPLILIFVVMYFLMIMPQRRKEKALRKLIEAMAVGDQCQTSGGIIGKVANIKDNEVTIQTSVANTLITLHKGAIVNVVKPYSDDE